MRQAKITRTLEDGTIEETFIDLPDNTSTKKAVNKKSSRKDVNEDNKKQKEEQTTTTSAKINISPRTKG